MEESILNSVLYLSDKECFLRDISKTGGRASFLVGIYLDGNAGIELSPELIGNLERLSVGLEFDIYETVDKTVD